MSAPAQGVLARPRKGDQAARPLSVAGLFAGIGGIELGLHGPDTTRSCSARSTSQRSASCEPTFRRPNWSATSATIDRLPEVDLVAAGFPCQDLSQAGRTAGIEGGNRASSARCSDSYQTTVAHPPGFFSKTFRSCFSSIVELVMRFLVDSLEALGFTWAYRVVDARSFGLPQRRQRVLLACFADGRSEARVVLGRGG